MAIKYLAGNRIIGTAAERAALTTNQNFLSETGNSQSQLDESANKYGILLASNNPLLGEELESFSIMLRKRASPTGNIYAKIYKDDSTTATATSTNYFDASELPPEDGTSGNGAYGSRTWTFASGVTLEDGDRIVYEGGSHDGNNQITFRRATGGLTDTVSIATYTASWTSSPSGDPLYGLAVTGGYPSLTENSIFEESDTGKHYMWDGSTTWNEIA